MNAKTITSALIVAVLGFTLAMPGSALADRDNRGHRQGHSQNDGHKYRQHRRDDKQHKRHGKHSKHYAKRHYKHHNKHRKHHAKRYYKHHNKHNYGRHGHGGSRNYYYYDDDDDNDTENLLIGLVVGGILGYALNESQHNANNFVGEYDSYYQPNSYQGSSANTWPR